MREIKFRGINEETGEFVYGWYTKLVEGIRRFNAIISDVNGELTRFYIHDPKTVGQFTGLHDKNGKEIYEGDIVRWFINDIVITAEVYYEELQAWFTMGKGESGGLVLCDWMRGEYEVIGNIHENPELLK